MLDLKTLKQKHWAMVCFTLYFGWLLSFAFEGPVLYALVSERQVQALGISQAAVLAHFLGLTTAWLYIDCLRRAGRVQLFASVVCFVGTCLLSYLPEVAWLPVIAGMAFIAGWVVAAWGYYVKGYFHDVNRMRLSADMLIYTSVLLIAASGLTKNISANAGLAFILIGLAFGIILSIKFTGQFPPTELVTLPVSSIGRPFITLCLFIFINTISSGIMYQVVYPAFPGYERITSIYQAVPYIAAILLLRFFAHKLREFQVLYIGLSLLGLAYVFFMLLDRSIYSYFIVVTMMLAACGITDLFWWSILSAMLSYAPNPAQIFGVGLAMNVFGVWSGGLLITTGIIKGDTVIVATGISLAIILISVLAIPFLNRQLLQLLKEHVFLLKLVETQESEQSGILVGVKTISNLTDREAEIVRLLLKGYTYKVIANQLHISENTLKTHVKNIYGKLAISSRMELIKMLEDNCKLAEPKRENGCR